MIDQPSDLTARAAMQWGASLAGLAIENSMLGAAHALANPLTARFGLAHGEAVGLMLPHVIRFNGELFQDWYRELAEVGPAASRASGVDAAGGLAEFVDLLLRRAGLAARLSCRGVTEESLPALAADAARQWTGTFNPRDVAPDEWVRLYQQAF